MTTANQPELTRREFLQLSGSAAVALAATAFAGSAALVPTAAQAAESGGKNTQGAGDVLSLPKGGGAIRGMGESFQANPFTGTADFSVPIATSPGRGGFGPQLALHYSSGNGNGPFGLGWALSVPQVSRKTEKGIPRYDDTDTFLLSGAEDLVAIGEAQPMPVEGTQFWVTTYRPRTEGLFARIEKWEAQSGPADLSFNSTFWRVTTKENITNLYGRTPQAVVMNPARPGAIFQWLLELTYDAKGNYVRYEYKVDTGDNRPQAVFEENHSYQQRYLKRICYGNRQPLQAQQPAAIDQLLGQPLQTSDHFFSVLFDYGEHGNSDAGGNLLITDNIQRENQSWPVRPDPFSTHRSGFELRTLRRCQRMLMLHHQLPGMAEPTLVKSTDFTYTTNPDTQLSLLTSVTQRGYRRVTAEGDYQSEEIALGLPGVKSQHDQIRSTPPVEFVYSEFRPQTQHFQAVTAVRGEMPPRSLKDPNVALVDLFGCGLPDVVETTATGFEYWRNLGNGQLAARQRLPQHLAGLQLAQTGVGFGDVDGDGRADLLFHQGAIWGYFPAAEPGGWAAFRPYATVPSFDLNDPNVRLLDLTGDGKSDVLRSDPDHFTFFRCLGEAGFAAPELITRRHDLAHFPDLTFNDPQQRVRLADMNGDGLQDLVLLYDGHVDYWPNQGYGRFGARITMQAAPHIGNTFQPERLFLVDLDGNGTADLVYIEDGQVRLWFNQAGNGWSAQQIIHGTPPFNDSENVQFSDFLGNGTTGILWSGDYQSGRPNSYHFLDLNGGVKPHLLVEMRNNLGASTRVAYGASTTEYLRDLQQGNPWITPLPFPVRLVSKVEVLDLISHTKLVTTYRYHHGYYDGREREFRGFGFVEQEDTEHFNRFAQPGLHDPSAVFTNQQAAYHLPPVLTKRWYHTGVPDEKGERWQHYQSEWYAGDRQVFAQPAPTVAPTSAVHEAYRALRGALLREEVYAATDDAQEPHPYTAATSNYHVRQLQSPATGKYGVFLNTPVATLTYHYERNPQDPRIAQQINLKIDTFGNVTDRVAISYPRRAEMLPNDPQIQSTQAALKLVYDHIDFINPETPLSPTAPYYVGVTYQTRSYEVTGIALQDATTALTTAAFTSIQDNPDDFKPYEWQSPPDLAQPTKRLIQWSRTYFRKDDETEQLDLPTAPNHRLPLSKIGALGLPYATYQAAYSAALPIVRGTPLDAALLSEGGYQSADGMWWQPTGTQGFDAQHFYLPLAARDPFGNTSFISYDDFNLSVRSTRDPVDNVVQAEIDYRVLQPYAIIDPNGNRAAVAFDALGMVVGTAVMGKAEDAAGDSLVAFMADIDLSTVSSHLADPLSAPHSLLQQATTRLVYDLWAFRRTRNNPQPQPAVVYTLAREEHVADEAPDQPSPIQHAFAYSDGFGREIQKKIQAEPGPLTANGAAVAVRWVGSGWTIFNNKGKPVQQYEPFFSASHAFEDAPIVGVSSTLFYDPIGRVVATIHPNQTYEKVLFDPWQQAAWDVNDTLLLHPGEDTDIQRYVLPFLNEYSSLHGGSPYTTWYQARVAAQSQPSTAETEAAHKSETHAATPTLTYFDTLGRPFLSMADNGADATGQPQLYRTHSELDIAGKQLAIRDALGRVVMRYDYDLLGNRIHQASVEAGKRWLLNDVAGQPVRTWDSRGHQFRSEYDALRRPLRHFVRGLDGSEADPRTHNSERLFQHLEYGEGQDDDQVYNLRTRLFRQFDGAGIITNERYDFKGNLLESKRQLTQAYKDIPDWAGDVLLAEESYTSQTSYDALNRPTRLQAPDGSQIRPKYNEANLLNAVSVNLLGTTTGGEPVWTAFVTNIDYNAKGQRTTIHYGNGVTTDYSYDPNTFRLTALQTQRGTEALQALRYTYDPVGNITHIQDDAQQTIYFAGQVVTPHADYTYDAIYRLITATGREHIGQVSQPAPTWNDQFRQIPAHPNKGEAMRNYSESYDYDAVGNFVEVSHQAADGNWTRSYAYNEPSLLEATTQTSNRLSSTQVGTGTLERYSYDSHGNMTTMPHLSTMQWDFADQLSAVDLQGGGKAYYVYDAAGQRVRKVVERNGATVEERIYLGGFEVYRQRQGGSVQLERQTLHIMDDKQRIALVETRTQGADGSPKQLVRYQLSNHLGSAVLEVDDQAQVISYEEYYPYGSTSYQAVRSQVETPKRYRYTGKERDEESGLYYHRARYYAPWLGRWTSTDPDELVDGINLYNFVNASPTRLIDKTGKYGEGGHFYTVYFVSLSAGFDQDIAFRNAIFAQMPDELNALDAIHQQISAITALGGTVTWANRERDLVQRGLHSLTGGDTITERNLTRTALAQVTPGTIEFGFLLHRFGDSYAHSVRGDESKTYNTGMGHAIHGHTPDLIHLRPNLYREYVKDLFKTLTQIGNSVGNSPRLSQEEIERFGKDISNITRTRMLRDPDTRLPGMIETLDIESTEKAQNQKIRDLSAQLMTNPIARTEGNLGSDKVEQITIGTMKSYAPEMEDAMSYNNYRNLHPNFVSGTGWNDIATAVMSVGNRVKQNSTSFYPLRSQ